MIFYFTGYCKEYGVVRKKTGYVIGENYDSAKSKVKNQTGCYDINMEEIDCLVTSNFPVEDGFDYTHR